MTSLRMPRQDKAPARVGPFIDIVFKDISRTIKNSSGSRIDCRFTTEVLRTMDTLSLLEQRYPHIVQGVLASWHDTEATERFLSSVLVDGRDGRDGLPEDAFAELLFLSELNWKRRHFNQQGVEFHPDNFSFGWN